MTVNQIWEVRAYSTRDLFNLGLECEDAHGCYEVFSEYFSSREAAHAVYARGEREMGIVHGVTWQLRGVVLDAPWTEQTFEELKQEIFKGDEVELF